MLWHIQHTIRTSEAMYLNTLAEDGAYWTHERTMLGNVAHPLAVLSVLV
jgi:hypothetical protein